MSKRKHFLQNTSDSFVKKNLSHVTTRRERMRMDRRERRTERSVELHRMENGEDRAENCVERQENREIRVENGEEKRQGRAEN